MGVEHIKHWKVGNVEIARIVEVNNHHDPMAILLGAEATPQFVQQFKWLAPHFATADGEMLISFQCFVLSSRDRRVMIDTCIGADRQREFPIFCNMKTTFLEDLEAAGFPPDTINAVLCTHLHFDHVGWNTRLVNGRWVPTFPNARYLFGQREWEHWQHLRRTGGYHSFEHITDSIEPILEAKLADFVDEARANHFFGSMMDSLEELFGRAVDDQKPQAWIGSAILSGLQLRRSFLRQAHQLGN